MLTSAYSRAAALQSYCTHKNRGQTWYLTPVVSSSLPQKTQQTTFVNSPKAVTIQALYLYNFVSFFLSYRAFPTGEKVVIVNKFKAKFSTLLKPRLRERMVSNSHLLLPQTQWCLHLPSLLDGFLLPDCSPRAAPSKPFSPKLHCTILSLSQMTNRFLQLVTASMTFFPQTLCISWSSVQQCPLAESFFAAAPQFQL